MIFHCHVENHHNEPPVAPYSTDLFPLTTLTIIVGPTTYGPYFLLESQIRQCLPSSWRLDLFPEIGIHPSRYNHVVADRVSYLTEGRVAWRAMRTHSLELIDAILAYPSLPRGTTVVWVADGDSRDTSRCVVYTLMCARHLRCECGKDLR